MTIILPVINKGVGVLLFICDQLMWSWVQSREINSNVDMCHRPLPTSLLPDHRRPAVRLRMLSCVSLQPPPPPNCRPPGSSVRGIFPAGILDWVAISSSRGSSQLRDRTRVSCHSCLGKRILYHLATWESMAPSTTYLNLTSFDISLSPQSWL